MATVVNARDVQLPLANPRLNLVTMASNIQVDQSNVTGLGLIVAGTKQIWLSSTSQIFQVPKAGSTTPASITVTANVRNLTTTPTLTIVAGSGTMSVVPALTAGVFTFTPAQLTSDAVTLRLTLVENSVTYSDDLTVVRVREGIDSISGFLTNESHTLPGDSSGSVTNYAGAGGNFKVFQGTTDVTTVCTFALVAGGNPDNLTYTLTAAGASAGAFSVTGGYPTAKNVTTLTFRATFGTSTIDKIFTVSKANAGAAGAPGAAGATGTAGARGSQTFYVALSGGTNTYSDTLATTTATSNGGPIMNDVVVQYNNSVSFSQTKFWNGTSWSLVNAVVDGNLLVSGTVGTAALSANSVTAGKIDSRGLSIKDASGNVILAAGSPLLITNLADQQGFGFAQEALRKNMVDPSRWAVGVDGWTAYGTAGTQTQLMAVGSDGSQQRVWQVTSTIGQANWQGGPLTRRITIDPAKTYRYIIPVKRVGANIDSGFAYIGVQQFDSNVCDLNTSTLSNNAYFAATSLAGLTQDRWGIAVGYVYPAGSSGMTSTDAGIYDALTGAKIVNGTNFCWASSATVFAARQGLYRSTAFTQNVTLQFGQPLLQSVDGSEYPLVKFFAPSAFQNNAISISSTGVLSGAGGGQVTALPTIDLGAATGVFGARTRNDAPSEYPYGMTKQLKTATNVGLNSLNGAFCTLETTKQATTAASGGVYQYGYQGTTTWRRYSADPAGDATTWGAWVQDLDRNAYTGTLDANTTSVDTAGKIQGVASGAGTAVSNDVIAFAGNVCYNADFSHGLQGWTVSSNPFAAAYDYCNSSHVVMAGAARTLNAGIGEGTTTLHVQQPNSTTTGYFEIQSDPIIVVAGKRYAVSAYTGALRCSVDVFVYAFDAAGNNTASFGAGIDINDEASNGGQTLAGYKRHQQAFTAPAGCTSVKVCLRKNATKSPNTDSFMFVVRVQLEEVGAMATAAGPWNPPGFGISSSRQITGTNISTFIASAAIGDAQVGNLSAAKITVGKLVASQITVGDLTTAGTSVGSSGNISHGNVLSFTGVYALPFTLAIPSGATSIANVFVTSAVRLRLEAFPPAGNTLSWFNVSVYAQVDNPDPVNTNLGTFSMADLVFPAVIGSTDYSRSTVALTIPLFINNVTTTSHNVYVKVVVTAYNSFGDQISMVDAYSEITSNTHIVVNNC